MKRRLPIGLFAKFLLVLVPVFAVLSAIGIVTLSRYDVRAKTAELGARVGTSAARVAAGSPGLAPLRRERVAGARVGRGVGAGGASRPPGGATPAGGTPRRPAGAAVPSVKSRRCRAPATSPASSRA